MISKKSGSVRHNITWAPNTMLSSRKNYRSNSKKNSEQKNPSGHGQESYERINELRGIVVDNKGKIQYNSA